MIDWISKYKVVTHALAVAVAAVYGFSFTPAGQALANQYPLVSKVFAGLATIALLYHIPKKPVAAVLLFLTMVSLSSAQTVTPPPPANVQQWSLQTSAVSLPGGKTSVVGVDAGITFTPSSNLDIVDRNLLSSDGSLKYFAGGITYRLPAISTMFNNMASNTNFLRLRFAPTASFGIAQVNGVNHYGFTGGFRVDYMLTASGSWTFGGQGEYAHFPGYPGKAIVELNAAFHF